MDVLSALMAVLVLVAVLSLRGKRRSIGNLPKPSAEVVDLVQSGKRISAIKLYRAETGATLYEASKIIDGITMKASGG